MNLWEKMSLHTWKEFYGSSVPKSARLKMSNSMSKKRKTFDDRVFERAIQLNEAYGDLTETTVRRYKDSFSEIDEEFDSLVL
jgi:hypothetical protein